MRVMRGIEWAAGLFVGEGCVGKATSNNSSGSFEYLSLQIGMYDERSIRAFADIVGASVATQHLKHCKKPFFKVHLRGRPAERALARMWPYIEGTSKGDQTLKYARLLGVEVWVTGQCMDERRPQLHRMKRGPPPCLKHDHRREISQRRMP